jgi:phage-related protein
VSEFFGFEDTALTDLLDIATKAGEYAAMIFVGFVGALVAVAAVIGVVVAACIAWTATIYGAIAAVVYFSVQLIAGIVGAFEAVKTYLSEIDLAQVGADILQGLANGITGAAGFVKDAVSNAVNAAIKSAKDLLGIASPSKVFAEIGGYTGEGFAGGVEDSAPEAQAAMTDMVDPAPAAAKASEGAPAGGGSSGGKPSVHIENLYLAGAKASKEETLSLSEALTRLIQGDAAALGGGA